MEAGDGSEDGMEREEGGGVESEPMSGRDKILCYISMQSPGRSSDPNLELLTGGPPGGSLQHGHSRGFPARASAIL